MQKVSSPDSSPKVTSISRRFSYTLISIVTLLLIVFTTIVILFNISRIEKGMEKLEINIQMNYFLKQNNTFWIVAIKCAMFIDPQLNLKVCNCTQHKLLW